MECTARAHILSEDEVKSALSSQSARIRTVHGTYNITVDNPDVDGQQATSCLLLHRCHKNGGCCPSGHECSPKTVETVSIDITVSTRYVSNVMTSCMFNQSAIDTFSINENRLTKKLLAISTFTCLKIRLWELKEYFCRTFAKLFDN